MLQIVTFIIYFQEEKRMKKVLCVLLALLLTVTIAGCDSNQSEQAVWGNYPDVSFTTFLSKGIKGIYANDPYNFTDDIRISSEQGWNRSESLSESSISDGNTAYTYVADVYFDGELGCSFYFFMEYDKPTKQLKAKGGMSSEYFEDYEDTTTLTSSETIKTLEQLKQFQ